MKHTLPDIIHYTDLPIRLGSQRFFLIFLLCASLDGFLISLVVRTVVFKIIVPV